MHDARKLLAADGWRLARQHRSSSWSPPPPPPRPYDPTSSYALALCQKRTMPSVYGALGYVKIPPGQRTVDERDCPSLRCPMVVHIRDGREGCHCSSGSSESAEHHVACTGTNTDPTALGVPYDYNKAAREL